MSIEEPLEAPRTHVLFRGGFEVPTLKEGPAVLSERLLPPAKWLAGELARDEAIRVGEPDFIDYAYEITCQVGDRVYPVEVSFDFLTWAWFEISFYPSLGRWARFRGRTENVEMARLSSAIHAAVSAHPSVLEVRWYRKLPEDPDDAYARSPT